MIKIVHDDKDELRINVDARGLEALKALIAEVEQSHPSVTSTTASHRYGDCLLSLTYVKGQTHAQNRFDDGHL